MTPEAKEAYKDLLRSILFQAKADLGGDENFKEVHENHGTKEVSEGLTHLIEVMKMELAGRIDHWEVSTDAQGTTLTVHDADGKVLARVTSK